MGRTSHNPRLRAVWLIVLPFLWFSTPTGTRVLIGGALAAVGLWLRGWSAGTIRKDEELATTGPYAFTRNPLYLGSFVLGLGVSVTGGHWVWPLVFVVFFVVAYSRTMVDEARRLGELFPGLYSAYALAVPAFFPRVTRWRPRGRVGGPGFRWSQYRRNREWEASLGVLAAFAILAAKLIRS